MDRSPRKYRDPQRPAIIRWEKMMDYYLRYNFQYVSLGPTNLKMNGPITFPISNHFEKPRLRAKLNEPIIAENIEKKLSKGLYEPPRIERIYLYSVMDLEVSNLFL
jgi:hypothetical protein